MVHLWPSCGKLEGISLLFDLMCIWDMHRGNLSSATMKTNIKKNTDIGLWSLKDMSVLIVVPDTTKIALVC